MQRHGDELGAEPAVVEQHFLLEVGDAATVDEVVRQLAELAQVVAQALGLVMTRVLAELERLFRHHPVSFGLQLRHAWLNRSIGALLEGAAVCF